MSASRTLAVARRVLTQLRRDHRSIAMVVVVPCMLLWILQITFQNATGVFDRIGPMLLGIFPFVMIFLITSITMLRERNQGTLDRMLVSPIGKADIMVGYSLAFGVLATLQVAVGVAVGVGLLDMPVQGSVLAAFGIVLLLALYGTALGLTSSAFAQTEFQAVQFMPLLVLPQIFLSGLLVPVDTMPRVLRWVAAINPLRYSLALLSDVMTAGLPAFSRDHAAELVVTAFVPVVLLLVGSITMQRNTES